MTKIYAGNGGCSEIKYIVVNLTRANDYEYCSDYLFLSGTDHCDRQVSGDWHSLNSIPNDMGVDGGARSISVGTAAADASFGVDLVVDDLPFDAWGGTISTGQDMVSLGTVNNEFSTHLEAAEAGHAWVLVGDTWEQTNALAPDGSVASLSCAAPPVQAFTIDAGPSLSPEGPGDAGSLLPAPECSALPAPPPDSDPGGNPVGLPGVIDIDASVVIDEDPESARADGADAAATAAGADSTDDLTHHSIEPLDASKGCACSTLTFSGASNPAGLWLTALAFLAFARRHRLHGSPRH